MKTSLLSFTSLLSLTAALFSSPQVVFETQNNVTTASTIPLGNGLVASLAVVGTKVNTAKPLDQADDKNVKPYEVAFHDPITRLAFLKLETADETVPTLGSSTKLKAGDALYLDPAQEDSLARLISREHTYAAKLLPVSFFRVHYTGKTVPATGTPLYNKAGEICAIVHQPAPSFGNGSYALPVEVLKRSILNHQKGQDNSRCWIGIAMEAKNIVPSIVSVRPESPASKAGLKRGDILLQIGNRSVTNYEEAVDAFYYFTPGKAATFHVLRGTQKLALEVTPEVNPISKKKAAPVEKE